MIYSLIPDIECHELFIGVPKDYVEQYLNGDGMVVKTIPPDRPAYSQETQEQQIAVIIDGAARVYAGSNEEKALIRTLNKGDIFGIANLYYEKEPFPSQIITAANTTILFIDKKKFRDYIENNPIATKNYMQFLSRKIIYLNKKLATLTAGNAEKKLASYICEHQIDGVFTTDSLSELANILQMGRASLYRALDSMTENGIIVKKGKTLIISNYTKLKNI